MIDFHSHILYGIDDGAKNVDMSIEILRQSFKQGITKIIATPHYHSDRSTIEEFLEKRQSSYDELMEELSKVDFSVPQIILGAEVHVTTDALFDENLHKLAIEGTRCILLEMPYDYWHKWIYDSIYEIYANRHLIPVMAHIERYLHMLKKRETMERMLSMDIYMQMNATSVIDKDYGKYALRMIKNNMIHVIGSDCHNITTRKSDMQEAMIHIRKKLGNGYVETFEKNAIELLSGVRPEKDNMCKYNDIFSWVDRF